MRIVGIGLDIVEIARIDDIIGRHGSRFLERVFAEPERRYCSTLRTASRCYAARFAAKEAASKALGTGIGEHAGWLDLVVERSTTGKPSLKLSGEAAKFAARMGISEILISLTHSDHYAAAQAIAVSAED